MVASETAGESAVRDVGKESDVDTTDWVLGLGFRV